jgi:hypothetical protein
MTNVRASEMLTAKFKRDCRLANWQLVLLAFATIVVGAFAIGCTALIPWVKFVFTYVR